MSDFYIKANRVFSPWRKYAWIFTLTVAIGGLWFPILGLLVIPVMVGLTTVAFVRGRFWCGNICPHGSLFDSLIYPFTGNRKIPKFFKSKTFGILFFTFFGVNLVRKFVKVSALWGTYMFWERLGFIFVASYLMVTVVGGVVSLLISARTWCNFCPMGTLQKISYKLGKITGLNKNTDVKITAASTDMCHTCGKCSRVCPMQLTPYLEFDENNQFSSENCIRCSTCVVNCPANILSLGNLKEAQDIMESTPITGYEHKKVFPATIQNIRSINDTTNEYVFKFEDDDIKYTSGQFILVKIQDIPEMYRAYSISGFDSENKTVTIDVKKAPNGYGTGIIFDTFKEGDKVTLQGPMGHELIVDKEAKEVVMVAGGIGITPFRAIVKDLVENESNIEKFTLVYGANYENEFMFDDEFKSFAEKSDKFDYVKVAAFDDNFKGPRGFVTDVLKEMNLNENKIYMCGPPPMTKAAEKMLLSMDVPTTDIAYESA
ncbi:4Fe-4S binding protein [Alkalibacter mobilis]|uniref:4Fe-4S binding protein n=1 Tax=Alkalibacter mobilis TaxID=2787712 RepID=UPI00189ED776|nr:4Fe-4S binding protein [Alkalibacter mobilis]MBF7096466.1 4Fe-4S binding protein [Alkalibacter mobilis]